MKIIGRCGDGYVVTMTETEVANVAGFWSGHGDEFQKAMSELGAYQTGYRGCGLREGVEIPVAKAWRRLSDLRQREDEVRRAAASLRGLADLMDGALPAVTVPAAREEDPVDGVSS